MNDLQQRAAAIDWWHGGTWIHDATFIEGRTYPAVTLLPYLHLPADLSGKTVCDICTWDGYMAFECERRGARVTAVDSFAWDKQFAHLTPGLSTGRDGFDLAHDALNSRVTPVHCDVLDLKPSELGTFDIVLFLGVLYHMRHPLLALGKVAALCDDLLILESHVMTDNSEPAMRFYAGDELNDDPTNYWGPNTSCIEAMLCDVGFEYTRAYPGCGEGRAVVLARRGK